MRTVIALFALAALLVGCKNDEPDEDIGRHANVTGVGPNAYWVGNFAGDEISGHGNLSGIDLPDQGNVCVSIRSSGSYPAPITVEIVPDGVRGTTSGTHEMNVCTH